MAWRFRRRLRILPGLTLNFSKNGASSLTVGGRGLSTNIPLGRSGGQRSTVGLPGTGLSYTHTHERKSTEQRRQQQRGGHPAPTTQQIIDTLREHIYSPDSNLPELLWTMHDVGLVRYLTSRDDTPRTILEKCQLIVSWDRMELHLRRGTSPADTVTRYKQIVNALVDVHRYAVEKGIVQGE